MTSTQKKACQKFLESQSQNKGRQMKRVFAKDGMSTCWSCGSSNVKVEKDNESEKFPFFVVCEDCGERTLNANSESNAKRAWNRAYAVHVD